ncbi:hypothetical protein [Apilactobacillus xinyiensis]|uniref:hypothetical protein n=1 Tax=Apilactobacillus xinyiensis TaxID=2841032 RepID=UPI002010B56D|nr:hypothetical protein [Apilactobacillus xinyiensis]MCL0319407.1 hypothetical protein [Apilactobacillus xinyiensis]
MAENQINTPKKFIQMPIDDLTGKGLNSTDKIIYSQIYTMLNIVDVCFMSNAKLAEGVEVTTRSVSRSISKLREVGLINVEIIYKKGSKEIEKRYITLSTKMSRGYRQKCPYPTTKTSAPHDKNVQEKRLLNRLSNKEEEEEASLEFYKSVWPEPNEILQSKLSSLVKENGQVLFDHAINVAASNGVTIQTSCSYLSKILNDWKKNNVVDIKTADEYMKQRKDKGSPKQLKKVPKKRTVKESLPEWAEDGYKPPKENIDTDKQAKLKQELENI